MLEKQGFVGLSTGGNGVFYVRPSAITAIQERTKLDTYPDRKSRVFLQGHPEPFLIQEDPATIGQAIAAVEKKQRPDHG